jgi:hypothetical protein
MLLPKHLLILLAILTQIGEYGKAKLLNLNRILPLIALQKIEQVIHDPLLTNLQLILLLKQRGIRKGLETLLPPLDVGHVGEELGQAENSLLLLEVVFHVEDYVGQDA